MYSINFVLLGDASIASQLGKKGTATDIIIYDRKTADTVYTWTAPATFPDKIQPLLQAVNIAEYAILNVSKLDKFLGEQVMALDSVGLLDGFVMHSYEVDREKLRTLLKGTALASYQFVDSVDQLKQEMEVAIALSDEGSLDETGREAPPDVFRVAVHHDGPDVRQRHQALEDRQSLETTSGGNQDIPHDR